MANNGKDSGLVEPSKKRKAADVETQSVLKAKCVSYSQHKTDDSFSFLKNDSSIKNSNEEIAKSLSEVKTLYRMDFPDDFGKLWKFCAQICPSCPKNALLEPLGFSLCGPYDVFCGTKISEPFLHYRYHLDPPEFQTIITVPKSPELLHFGYFRDDPNLLPSFVVSSRPKSGCVLKYKADNLLELVHKEISDKVSKSQSNENRSLDSLLERLEKFAKKESVSLQCRERAFKDRKRRTQGTTFHKLGISVPVKDDIGYRPIHHDDTTLRKMMQRVAQCSTQTDRMAAFGPLHEQITFVQFANDESDFGMGLELGLNFFLHGSECFHKTAAKLMPVAYKFLNRDLYAEVIEKHLANRNSDPANIVYLT